MQNVQNQPLTGAVVAEPEQAAPGGLVLWLSASCRHIALLAAWIATLGSLYLSEVLGWVPCVLCWYQRILMYPLALILAIGIFRDDRRLYTYALPFALIGAATSLYHYLLIKTTWFPPPECSLGIPCTIEYMNLFGFINVPFLALTAFTIISVMMGNYVLIADDDALSAPGGATGALVARSAAVVIIVATLGTFVGLGLGWR